MNTVVGVALGGFTSEHNISNKSGNAVFNALQKSSFDLYKVHITRKDWSVSDRSRNVFKLNKGDFSFVKNGVSITFDVIVNMIHGAPGENGQLAGMLELLKIPQTSCSSYVAALTYNKRDCLAVARSSKIPTARFFTLDQGNEFTIEEIEKAVGFPCFVKANRAGSSFGVSKVYTAEELPSAIEKSFEEDNQVLIETALEGREFSVGVCKWKNKINVLPITEIISENDFFDYEAKYGGKSQEITPAKIPEEWERTLVGLSKKIYKQMGLEGVVRSEFIFENGIAHLLEINTIPGMTLESLIPQQLEASGISLTEFMEELISETMKKKKYL
jgi:D-alanine-D-alanine ligase